MTTARVRKPRVVAAVAVAVVAAVAVLAYVISAAVSGDDRSVRTGVPRLGHVSLPPLPAGGPELFRFVSIPDFLNLDIADAGSGPVGSLPDGTNSINRSWRKAVGVVLDQVKAEEPQAVLVAGDLVGGHWGQDESGSGVFGPVGSDAQRRAAIARAGELYYGQWARFFADRDLTVFPAVGDHDIGDNPWPAGSFEERAVPTYRQVFARHFTLTPSGDPRFAARPVGTPQADTAYAVRFGDTLLVTVDVFSDGPDGVTQTVEGGQLKWLDSVLTSARRDGVEHIIVQGHTPVLGAVRDRHSSGLTLEGGADSPFWKVLRRHQVDLYLCGEVHDMTTLVDGPVQVCHGALLSHGESNYLLGRVYADRIELELKEFSGGSDWSTRLWSTSSRRPAASVHIDPGPLRVGTAVIDGGAPYGRRLLDPRGYLSPP